MSECDLADLVRRLYLAGISLRPWPPPSDRLEASAPVPEPLAGLVGHHRQALRSLLVDAAARRMATGCQTQQEAAEYAWGDVLRQYGIDADIPF